MAIHYNMEHRKWLKDKIVIMFSFPTVSQNTSSTDMLNYRVSNKTRLDLTSIE